MDDNIQLPDGVTLAMYHAARALAVQLDISVQAALDVINEVISEVS